MKRFLSLTLTFLMVFLSVSAGVTVQAAVTEKTYQAVDDIYNEVEGEGFHHNSQGKAGLEKSGKNVVLRKEEWICYDISDLESGAYNLTIKTGSTNDVPVSVLVDDVEVLSEIEVPSTGGTSKHAEFLMGEIELSGGHQKIKILNAHASRTIYVNSFTLKKVDPLALESYSVNAGTSDAPSRGADVITLNMSAEVDTLTVTEENVYIKDSEEKILASELSADGNTVTIKLKESLDFESTYTIHAEGLKAANGAEMAEAAVRTFKTADSSDMTGAASIEVTAFTEENGKVTAEGAVKSSLGLGIKGRNVLMTVKGENDAEAQTAANVISAEDGLFTISYTMPDSAQAGKYEIYITSDYVLEGYTDSILYFSESLDSELAEAFSGLTDVADVEAAAQEYEIYLGVDMAWAESAVSDFSKVYGHLLNKTFESAEAAINAYKEAVYFEAVVQAESKDACLAILDDEETAEQLTGFNTSLWNALEPEGKANVAEKAVDFELSDMAELSESLNDEVKAELIIQFNLSASDISFTSDEIITGETAEIKAAIASPVSNVCAVHVEFAYSEESADLFETDELQVTAPDGMTALLSAESNVLSVDLKAENSVSLSGDILTIKIPASGKAGGEHTPKARGYISYHPETITDEGDHLDISFTVSQNPVIKVNEITTFETLVDQVIERTEGVGFHDDPASGGSVRGLETGGGGSVCLRTNEWTAYDISALAEGTYEMTVSYASTSTVSFGADVDGSVQITEAKVPLTGGYGIQAEAVIGRLALSGEQKILKLLNTGTAATYAKSISLIRVDAFEITDFAGNLGIEDGTAPRGTDRFAVTFNNTLSVPSVTEENVSLKREDGALVSVKVSASGNSVIIDLKETLDYSKNYTVVLNDICDRFGQVISDTVSVRTADETVNEGKTSIEINTWKVNGEEFTAEGVILSSGGVGIKGRTVKISVKSPESSSYEEWMSGITGADGKFTLSYTFDGSAVSGQYPAEVLYEYGKSAYRKDIYYFDGELSSSLAAEFSNLPTGEAVTEKLYEHAEVLGIDLSEFTVDISYITKEMTNKTYTSATEIIDEVNKRHTLEKVNQSTSKEDVYNIINDENALKDIEEIQRDKWNALSEDEKNQIAGEIYEEERIAEPEDLIKTIDEKINELLQARYGISGANVSVTSDAVNVGNKAQIMLTASAKQENVVKIHVELEYTEEEAKLLKSRPEITLSKDLKNLSVEETHEDGKTIYDISVAQSGMPQAAISTVSFRNDIITLSYMAQSGTEGTYSPKVSGYITYHADESEENQTSAYFTDIPFAVTSLPTITVSALQTGSTGDYQGGGGKPGGSGYGTTGGGTSGGTSGGSSQGGASSAIVPTTTQEGLTTEPMFNDLDAALWAKDSIEALAVKGIVSGRGDGSFAPNENVTRAEFCKMITIAFGKVKDGAVCGFSDVPEDSWYYIYIASAKEAGLVNGKTENIFAPNDTITREEMAAIALRALNNAEKHQTESFADDASISDYAKDGVYTLKGLGILDGVGNNQFAPKMSVTRAMAAKVIYMLTIV